MSSWKPRGDRDVLRPLQILARVLEGAGRRRLDVRHATVPRRSRSRWSYAHAASSHAAPYLLYDATAPVQKHVAQLDGQPYRIVHARRVGEAAVFPRAVPAVATRGRLRDVRRRVLEFAVRPVAGGAVAAHGGDAGLGGAAAAISNAAYADAAPPPTRRSASRRAAAASATEGLVRAIWLPLASCTAARAPPEWSRRFEGSAGCRRAA